MLPDVTKITVGGYRSIEHTTIDLHRINILIGANGSGKSNFISLFDLLRAITQDNLQTHIARSGGANTQFYLGTRHTKTIAVKIEIDENTYEFKLAADTSDACYFDEEIVTFWIKRLYDEPYKESLGSGHRETRLSQVKSGDNTIQSFTRKNLESWFVYHFHDTGDHSPLKRTADIDEIAYLLPDGGNLAAYLYHLQQNEPEHYQGILSAIQLILPGFREFTYLKEEKSNTVRLRWKTTTSGDYTLPVSAFSDGTLRFIALATLFLQSKPPKLIIIDEPELGLHPHAITILAELIHIASSKSQIILSTQSSQLVSEFTPEDIIIAESVNGATTLSRPDKESLNEWLTDYSLGDIWQSNVIGGNP
ncbi:hypothetical protein McpSp1_11470 [Methanocorpusculaceae archaeon Sp1]|nr:hypothetical protein [Methanocorpusculaceae archaeon Sp1]